MRILFLLLLDVMLPSLSAHMREPPSLLKEASAVLRKASDIALLQRKEQRRWLDGELWRIAELQIDAGDLDGARRSLLGAEAGYSRDQVFIKLAEALARGGAFDRALEVVTSDVSD